MRVIQEDKITQFLEHVNSAHADKSYATKKSCLRKYDHFLEVRNIDVFDPPQKVANKFIEWCRQGEDHSDVYLDSIKVSVSSMYQYYEDLGEIDKNPFDEFSWDSNLFEDVNPQLTEQQKYIIERDLEGRKAVRLSTDDVNKIANNVEPPVVRNELLVRLLFHTALRTGEMSRVVMDSKSEWVDFEKRVIRIRSAKADPPQDHYYRRVYYSGKLDSLLGEWLENRASLKHSDSNHLFITTHSPEMRASHISRIVKIGAKNAGLNEKMPHGQWLITGHTLRHAAITRWANKTDLELHMIADIAGHASVDTTRDYIQDDHEEKRRQVQATLPM